MRAGVHILTRNEEEIWFPLISRPAVVATGLPPTRGRETGDQGNPMRPAAGPRQQLTALGSFPELFRYPWVLIASGSQAPRSSKGKASAYLTVNSLARREVAVVPPERVRPYDPTDVTRVRSWRHRQSVGTDSKTNPLPQFTVTTLALASREASETALDSLKDNRTRLGVRAQSNPSNDKAPRQSQR